MLHPDFIGIGAQKAGTTWLSHNLQLHPEIWMPGIKELHYFNDRINEPRNPVSRLYGKITSKRTVDRRWRRQVRSKIRRHRKHFSRDDFLWDLKYYTGAPGDRWYASLFEPGRGKLKGEITPAYSMLDGESIARVYNIAPRAKLIFMMRSPIERAWSQVVMRFDKSNKKDLDSGGRVQLLRIFQSEAFRSRTDYLRTLENWGKFYPEDQIFVGFLEDIHFYPAKLLESVYQFLGVDSSFKPQGIDEKVHSRSAGRMSTESAVYLAQLYQEELSKLDGHFGGYASFWRYSAEKLAEDPPEGDSIPYPLWESSLWTDWVNTLDQGAPPGSQEAQPQSGPLDRVWQAAGRGDRG